MKNFESPVVLHEQVILEPKLKQDSADIVTEMLRWNIGGMEMIIANSIVSKMVGVPMENVFFVTLCGAALSVGSFWKFLVKEYSDRKAFETYSISTDYGLSASRMVFKGEQFHLGDTKIVPGNNFILIDFKNISGLKVAGSSPLSAEVDRIYNQYLPDVVGAAKNDDYQFVVINTNPSSDWAKRGVPTDVENFKGKLRKNISQSVSDYLPNPRGEPICLTRSEFENMLLSGDEITKRIVSELNDSVVTALFAKYQSEGKLEKRQFERSLKFRLKKIIGSEIERLGFENTEMLRIPGSPDKIRTSKDFCLRETSTGLLFVTNNRARGETTSQSVDQFLFNNRGKGSSLSVESILKVNCQTLDEILTGVPRLARSRLSYLLYHIFNDVNKEMPHLSNQENSILFKNLKINSEEKSVFRAVLNKIPEVFLRGPSQGRGVLLALLMHTALLFGQQIKEWQTPDLETRPSPIEIPAKKPEWKVDGNMSPGGYYIETIYKDFSGGEWHQEEQKPINIVLPKSAQLVEDEQFLVTTRKVVLSQIGETKMKIPVKNGTKPVSLSVIDSSKQDIGSYAVMRYPNGTYELIVNQPSLVKTLGSVEIVVTFVEADGHEKARSIPGDKKPLNASKLTPESNELVNQLQGKTSQEVFAAIANTHVYRVTPDSVRTLHQASNRENVINQSPDKFCNCEVCNSYAVIAAQSLGHPVSYATGFLNGVGMFGEQNFLRSDAKHGFGIDEKGQLLDATPTVADHTDLQTNTYMDQLAQPVVTEEWDTETTRVAVEGDQKKHQGDQLKLISTLSTLGLGYIGQRKLVEFLRKRIKKEDVEDKLQELFANSFSLDFWRKSATIFNWISWAERPESEISQSETFNNTKQAYQFVNRNTDKSVLISYLSKPKMVEALIRAKGIKLSKVEAMKLRIMAQWIASH